MKLRFNKEDIEGFSLWSWRLLVFSYVVSLFGFIWPLELLAHFTLQYMIGGIILAIALLYFKRPKMALIALVISCLCLVESRWHLQEPFRFLPPRIDSVYTIATYNHNVGMSRFEPIQKWLAAEKNEFDVIVLLEATERTAAMAIEMAQIYPHQIHEPQSNAFGMVILSRHPFIETEMIPLDGLLFDSFASKVTIISPEAKLPLTIYALHPIPPGEFVSQHQRDKELYTVAHAIFNNPAKNIVMLGDWNITPFSPAFSKLLKISGMNYQSYGLLLNPTWPTFNFASFLKIPIDHIIFSDNLVQTGKETGPAFMSDHHMLIARFAEK